jgi:hypothetical protein
VSFDPTWLFLSLIISGGGLALFIYGKKQGRIPHLVAGLILLVYTYIVTSTLWMIAIAVLVLFALWWAVRQGW